MSTVSSTLNFLIFHAQKHRPKMGQGFTYKTGSPSWTPVAFFVWKWRVWWGNCGTCSADPYTLYPKEQYGPQDILIPKYTRRYFDMEYIHLSKAIATCLVCSWRDSMWICLSIKGPGHRITESCGRQELMDATFQLQYKSNSTSDLYIWWLESK